MPSENGKPKRTLASKLFDIFKEWQDFDIDGPAGEKIPIRIRALDHGQNSALMQRMQIIRARVSADAHMESLKSTLLDQAVRLPRPDIIEAILNLERPIAQEQADLAPDATPEQIEVHKHLSEEAAKEAAKVKKWEETRKEELAAMPDDEVRGIVVDRQASLVIQTRALNEFLDLAITLMVFDPETNEPLLTYEKETDGESNPDWIGRLATPVREQLVACRTKFLMKKDEKSIRAVAESPDFLPSGESVNGSTASPGETTETPLTSQQPSSPSTPSEVISTT